MDVPRGCEKAALVYKNTLQRDLMLTFLPPFINKYEKAPLYFIIPGGGWHTEDRQSMLDFSAKSVEKLRKEGFAVVSIDYRVSGEGVCMSEIITDCFDAARYIAHFADTLKIDRDKFFLSGHSAGAHLALMLAYAPEEMFKDGYEFDDKFSVAAAAVMSAPTVLYDEKTHGLKNIKEAFKDCYTKEELERTSPISYVKRNCPPTLLCAGTSDYLVYAVSSERLYEKLKDMGVPCKLLLSVGGGHSFEKVLQAVEIGIGMDEIQKSIIDFVLRYTEYQNERD